MSLIENSPEDIAKIRLKNFSYISEHKRKELAAQKFIASELARGENKAVMVDTDGVLAALYAIPQWVVWKYGTADRETGEPKKVLLNAQPSANNAYANCDNKLTWGSYAQAQDRCEASQTWKVPLQGVAFALSKNGIVILDLDHCIHDGMIDAGVQDIIDTINSYTELSPSGTGVHIIVYGNIPANVNHNGVEMYDQGKFMSVTGKHLSSTPTTIEHRQEQLDALYAEIAAKEMSTFVCGTCQLSDEEVLAKARSARSGPKFIRLFDKGDCSGHPSHSHADFDLCNMLAYWTGNDVSMIDRLFRRSALYREKWDRKARTGETYGEGTIKRALLSE